MYAIRSYYALGFRGEALPSIASVSRLRLTSRPADQEMGWQLYVEGGTVRHAEALGTPAGTAVEVRDLFFNTPGRRKFLRSDETEFGHLADVVTRLAMARPDIHLRLQHNGRTRITSYNVCYTKLLRLYRIVHPGWWQARGGRHFSGHARTCEDAVAPPFAEPAVWHNLALPGSRRGERGIGARLHERSRGSGRNNFV